MSAYGEPIQTHYCTTAPVFASWTAYRDGWEPGLPMGTGPTEAEAVADLFERELDGVDTRRRVAI